MDAAFNEYLFLAATVAPGSTTPVLATSGPPIYLNHSGPAGPVDLGSFAAGTELIFGLHVDDTGHTYYSGAAARNDDNSVHVYGLENDPASGTTYLGFEDMPGGYADYNYSDMRVTLTGVSGPASSGVPDGGSTSVLLLGAGVILVP